ncbi:ABC transporter substrate-binding protein [Carnobacterium inhibens]|jgi:putative ABC transport system substrate-binding protein|uniref:ABC transporter substrate-binding protein n=2 Tax=Carnobacterium inhibens TaxID=147709 RepID=U5SBM2_9LACT|nr:ABC transporter substrate-binding protein [Carnobacterium inhibens]AGY81222.1 ABC transporter substrate-binding protein [Carnobacterium inhibens subsp. gilichinskyi]MBC9825270.1 ABC transporter substrate-binding protein [Carnobacterium inhibens]MCM3513033.1 ABC transporter substrate-binding protein [Carnobacterium inhibens]
MRTNGMKKKMLLGLATVATGLVLGACGNTEETGTTETINVGILQYMEHDSLSQARKGFISELEDAGYLEGDNLTLNYQNAQGDQANLQSMSESLVGENDVILSIATPAAQSLATVTQEDPILFTAVTDPVDAGLVADNEVPGGNVTGTSDMVPIEEQIALLLSLAKDAKTIGIIYNSSEPNSKIQADLAQEAIEAEGLEVKSLTVTTTNDVQQVMTTLAQEVDAVYIPTDNTLASTMPTVGEIAEKYQLPVVPGSAEMVEAGGLATYGINYEELGRQTAQMALQIIEEGADPAEMPVETSNKLELVINEEVAKSLGIDPESIVLPD